MANEKREATREELLAEIARLREQVSQGVYMSEVHKDVFLGYGRNSEKPNVILPPRRQPNLTDQQALEGALALAVSEQPTTKTE